MPAGQEDQRLDEVEEHWNYSDDSGRGPREWQKFYPEGRNQSPINILVDYCDLHQSACTNCAPDNHHNHHNHDQHKRPLEKRLEVSLSLSASRRPVVAGLRRGHLDSVGNETESPDELDSDRGAPATRGDRSPSSLSDKSTGSGAGGGEQADDDDDGKQGLSANDCLTLWKSKKIGPLQMMRKSGQSAQVRSTSENHHNHTNKRELQQQQQRQNTRYCVTNKKIFLGYPRYMNSVSVCNTGHGWQVDMPAEVARHTLLCGPPLGDREYRLSQFHCHWGADHTHGSEHQVNGQSYSAELHFVHWNCSEFRSANEAARHKHGLAVLGVFVQALEGEHNRNKHLDKLLAGIQAVRDQPHATRELQHTKLDLKKLFPVNRWDYATYEGSLTTPPLSEVVDWIVFLQPIQCSASQVAEFRRLKCPSGELTKNCRPVQAHNQRTVTIWTHSHSH